MTNLHILTALLVGVVTGNLTLLAANVYQDWRNGKTHIRRTLHNLLFHIRHPNLRNAYITALTPLLSARFHLHPNDRTTFHFATNSIPTHRARAWHNAGYTPDDITALANADPYAHPELRWDYVLTTTTTNPDYANA